VAGRKSRLEAWKHTRDNLEAKVWADDAPCSVRFSVRLNYSPDGRMIVILVGDNRKAPAGPVPTDAEMITLYKSMIAYAGTYTVDGNQVTHHVDASQDERTTGTNLVRFFTLSDGLLTLTTAPRPNRYDGRMSVHTLVWEKMASFA